MNGTTKKPRLINKNINVMFSMAARVFLDDNKIDDYDEFHSDDETRYKVIGLVNKVLVVIYTERKEKIRIISVAVQTKKRRHYYGQFSYL